MSSGTFVQPLPSTRRAPAATSPPSSTSHVAKPDSVAARIQAYNDRDVRAKQTLARLSSTRQDYAPAPAPTAASEARPPQQQETAPGPSAAPRRYARAGAEPQGPVIAVQTPAGCTRSDGPLDTSRGEGALESCKGLGRRVTLQFAAPAVRRTSRAWEHRHPQQITVKDRRGQLVVVGPQSRSQVDAASPWAVEIKRANQQRAGKAEDEDTRIVNVRQPVTPQATLDEQHPSLPASVDAAQVAPRDSLQPNIPCVELTSVEQLQAQKSNAKDADQQDVPRVSSDSVAVSPSQEVVSSTPITAIEPWPQPPSRNANAPNCPPKADISNVGQEEQSLKPLTVAPSKEAVLAAPSLIAPANAPSGNVRDVSQDLTDAITLLDSITLEHRSTLTKITTRLSDGLSRLTTSVSTIRQTPHDTTPTVDSEPHRSSTATSQCIRCLGPKLRHDADVLASLLELVDCTATALRIDLAAASAVFSAPDMHRGAVGEKVRRDQRLRAAMLLPPPVRCPRPLAPRSRATSAPAFVPGQRRGETQTQPQSRAQTPAPIQVQAQTPANGHADGIVRFHTPPESPLQLPEPAPVVAEDKTAQSQDRQGFAPARPGRWSPRDKCSRCAVGAAGRHCAVCLTCRRVVAGPRAADRPAPVLDSDSDGDGDGDGDAEGDWHARAAGDARGAGYWSDAAFWKAYGALPFA